MVGTGRCFGFEDIIGAIRRICDSKDRAITEKRIGLSISCFLLSMMTIDQFPAFRSLSHASLFGNGSAFDAFPKRASTLFPHIRSEQVDIDLAHLFPILLQSSWMLFPSNSTIVSCRLGQLYRLSTRVWSRTKRPAMMFSRALCHVLCSGLSSDPVVSRFRVRRLLGEAAIPNGLR